MQDAVHFAAGISGNRNHESRVSDMMGRYEKIDLPVSKVRRYLEPGPIVLVTSAFGKTPNIMTMVGTR